MTVAIVLAIVGLLYMFWKIQREDKLDFTDMITANGRTVSLTKILQLVGGVTGTWVVIKMGMAGTITADIFMIYLTYVASIEGFSKFIQARYQYQEGSVRDYRGPDGRYGIYSSSASPYASPLPPQRRVVEQEDGGEEGLEAKPPRDKNSYK
jgi:hypothetical protein